MPKKTKDLNGSKNSSKNLKKQNSLRKTRAFSVADVSQAKRGR